MTQTEGVSLAEQRQQQRHPQSAPMSNRHSDDNGGSQDDAPAPRSCSPAAQHGGGETETVVVRRRTWSSSSSLVIVKHNQEMEQTIWPTDDRRQMVDGPQHAPRRATESSLAHARGSRPANCTPRDADQFFTNGRCGAGDGELAAGTSQRGVNEVRIRNGAPRLAAGGDNNGARKQLVFAASSADGGNTGNLARSAISNSEGTAALANANVSVGSQQQQQQMNMSDDNQRVYPAIDTADLSANQRGSMRQASSTHINRTNFYNNLLGANTSSSSPAAHSKRASAGYYYKSNYKAKTNYEDIRLFDGSEHDERAASRDGASSVRVTKATRSPPSSGEWARERGQSQERAGQQNRPTMTMTKSATLPAPLASAGGGQVMGHHGEIGGPPTAEAVQSERRHSGRREMAASGEALRNKPVGSMRSPQRASVRLALSSGQAADTNGGQSVEGQRASRSTWWAARPSPRVGKFVNYYPSTRQPQATARSPSGRRRQTSPYAFHVPLSRQQAALTRSKSPSLLVQASNQPPPPLPPPPSREFHFHDHYHPMSAYESVYFHEHNREPNFEEPEQYDDSQAAAGAVKQTRYGYVAPLETDRHQPPMSKFNKSLKSKTIEHIPSMVQMSVEQSQWRPAREHQDRAADNFVSNRSDNDLLKAHQVAWRHSDKFHAGHDNPFKPGTELSLEADLMVRLIKRGYPLSDLPQLVQAAKELLAQQHHQRQQVIEQPAAGRSKSCQKLGPQLHTPHEQTPTAGYLSSNIRQFNEGNTTRMTDPLGSTSPPPKQLEPCKQVWVNSLCRAKSVPRLYFSAKSDARQQEQESDDIGKLIATIEWELSALLKQEADARDHQSAANAEEAGDLGQTKLPRERVSPLGNQRDAATGPARRRLDEIEGARKGLDNRLTKMSSSASVPTFSAQKLVSCKKDLKSSGNRALLSASSDEELGFISCEMQRAKKEPRQKRLRCCRIQ